MALGMAAVLCVGTGTAAMAASREETMEPMHTHNLIIVEEDPDGFWTSNGSSGHVEYSNNRYYCVECGYTEVRVEVAASGSHNYYVSSDYHSGLKHYFVNTCSECDYSYTNSLNCPGDGVHVTQP